MVTNEEVGYPVDVVGVLQALGDRSRRSIVEELRSSPMAVGELAERLPISRPAISQHLKVLASCGLVTYRSRGTSNVYAIDPRALELLRDYVDVVWRDGLESFRRFVEEEQP